MEAMIAADGRGYVTAAAVNLVMKAQEEPATLAATLGATLAVPDGQPLVWALHALGHPRATRVYGPDLMARFCARAARERIPIYLYGGRDDDAPANCSSDACTSASRASRSSAAPRPPFRPLTPAEDERELRADRRLRRRGRVGRHRPAPAGAVDAPRCVRACRAPLLIGVGAAFDFHAGLVSQAPPWMQRNGLEWTYRLSREPRRLWPRYARYNPRFVAGFARQYARHLRGAGR